MNPTTSTENQETVRLEKLRAQISSDIEAMQQKETSLREYEQRLRLLVDHAHSLPPQPVSQYYNVPPVTQNLDAEWEKYHRAHSLLEAARRGLADDRLALRDREEKLLQREDELQRRESWIKAREHELELQAQAKVQEELQPKPKVSFTTAPFLAARNLLSRHG